MIVVKLKDELRAIQFDGNIATITKFIHSLGWRILASNVVPSDDSHGNENEYEIYYLNAGLEPKELYVAKDWYVILEQDEYELSSCAPDYFNEHYEKISG